MGIHGQGTALRVVDDVYAVLNQAAHEGKNAEETLAELHQVLKDIERAARDGWY